MGLEPRADQTGDGFITGQELAAYMKLRVTERNGNRQSPQYGEIADNDTQRGDFVFQIDGNPAVTNASYASDTAHGQRAVPRPVLPSFNVNRIFVAPVMGAPGDGNAALREAIRDRLGKEGIEVWDADSDGAFKLQTVVSVRSMAMLVDEVTIQWRLLDKNRGPVANFQQVSEVLTGSRNKEWGSAAAGSADFAARRLVKYLAAN